jgi:hypothetical protein
MFHLILGFALFACGDKDEDTAKAEEETQEDTSVEEAQDTGEEQTSEESQER